MPSFSPISKKLAEYIVTTSFKKLPVEAIESAKMTILDSITCMIGGLFTPAGKIVTNVMSKEGGNSESTVPGIGHKTNALNASLVNSILANGLDYDDYYPVSHPSATIIPPGLAVSEACKSNGKTFLTSVVVANEVYLRIMRSILASNEQRKKITGFGTHQTFGAAIVAGKILNLDKEQMAQALGIAGANAPVPSCSKTVWGDSVTMVKNNYGMSSFAGVLAAKLAKSGFTGPLDIFEGETGFWRMSGSDQFNPQEMTRGLGSDFMITRIEFKPYPCCRWIHPSLDGVSKIMKENSVKTGDIKKLEIRTHYLCTIPPFSNVHPRTFEEALFSIKYVVSLILLAIPRGPEWYERKTLNDPNVSALADKVTLIEDEEVDSSFPAKLLSKISLYTSEKSYNTRVDFPWGEPDNPMTKKDLEEKFREVTSQFFTNSKRGQLLEMIQKVEKLDDMNKLTALFH